MRCYRCHGTGEICGECGSPEPECVCPDDDREIDECPQCEGTGDGEDEDEDDSELYPAEWEEDFGGEG